MVAPQGRWQARLPKMFWAAVHPANVRQWFDRAMRVHVQPQISEISCRIYLRPRGKRHNHSGHALQKTLGIRTVLGRDARFGDDVQRTKILRPELSANACELMAR